MLFFCAFKKHMENRKEKVFVKNISVNATREFFESIYHLMHTYVIRYYEAHND